MPKNKRQQGLFYLSVCSLVSYLLCVCLTISCTEAKMGFSYQKTLVEDARTLKPGSHIRVVRLSTSSNEHGYYDHHMLVVSVPETSNQIHVIHYSQTGGEGVGSLNSFGGGQRGPAATVLEETITISKDDKIELLEYPDDVQCFSPEESILRAREKLGEEKYSLITNNCECFVNWAITNKSVSNQVQDGMLHTAAGFMAGVCRGYFQEGGSWGKALKEGATGASVGYSNYREKRK